MKQPKILFEHMLKAITQIEIYIKGYGIKKFKKDQKTIDAVIRQLEIIGEAAGGVPKGAAEDSPIPWNKITGMRHKLIHDYFGVDVDVVWDTVSKELAPLKAYLSEKVKS